MNDSKKMIKALHRFLSDSKILLWYTRMWMEKVNETAKTQLINGLKPFNPKRHEIVQSMIYNSLIDMRYSLYTPISTMLEAPIKFLPLEKYYELKGEIDEYYILNYGSLTSNEVLKEEGNIL